MMTWWLVLISRSSSDSATTGLERGYQSLGARLLVMIRDRPLSAGDLVLAEDLEEVEMPEFTLLGLGESGIEGLQHP
jgi:hypothetical protein